MYKTVWLIAAALTSAPHAHAQTASAPPPTNPGRGLFVMAPGCSFQFNAKRTRAGDNIPARMSLRNTGQWCLGSLSLSGSALQGAHVLDNPNHGDLRMRIIPEGILFFYRPSNGYRGSDQFLITMPTGGGYDTNLATSVTVEP